MYAYIWDYDGIGFQAVPFHSDRPDGERASAYAQIPACLRYITERGDENYIYTNRADGARRLLEDAGVTALFSGVLTPDESAFPLQSAPLAPAETSRRKDLRLQNCMLISNREDLLAAAKRTGISACYLDEQSLMFTTKDTCGDYYCANAEHLLSLLRYKYAPPCALRAKRTFAQEYPHNVMIKIAEVSCKPYTDTDPYDRWEDLVIDVRTGTPFRIRCSSRPSGHGFDSNTYTEPVSFDEVQKYVDVNADTWREHIGEKRIAEALARAEKAVHLPVSASFPANMPSAVPPGEPALFFSDKLRKAVWMRKKPDGFRLFAVKRYLYSSICSPFCSGHAPLENKAEALLLNPELTNDYEAYDRPLTGREAAYIYDYCASHDEKAVIDHLFAIAAYGINFLC